MAAKKYTAEFECDTASPTAVSGTVVFDGITYEVDIVPRTRRYLREERKYGEYVSQGPRGEVCPLCRR